MDYSTLIGPTGTNGSIASWVNSTACQAAAPTIIEEAQSFIYPRLRHWQMLTSTSGTATASATSLAIPGDFLEDKRFKITGTDARSLERKPLQEIIDSQAYDSNGARVLQPPSEFSNDKSNIIFDTALDKAYPFTLWYYQRPVALGTATAVSTNFLTGQYPRLMRAACMMGACEFMKDNGQGTYDRTYWKQEAENEIMNANNESDRHERSMKTDVVIE